jgi:calcineurin-like phosphoesterase family protein
MIFYTADHHFSHANIIKYENRIFLNIDEMNVFMIKRWNEVVGDDDTVYYLGDFSFDRPALFLKKLKGRKILLKGNHDRRTSTHYLQAGFDKVEKEMFITDTDKKIVLSHEPKRIWDGIHEGVYHFHGHLHSKDAEPFVANRYNVGVDVWNYYPKSADEIIFGKNLISEDFSLL